MSNDIYGASGSMSPDIFQTKETDDISVLDAPAFNPETFGSSTDIGTSLDLPDFDSEMILGHNAILNYSHQDKPVDLSTMQQQAWDIAVENQIDPRVFMNLIKAESNWNPKARSSVGAFGYAQLMPGTAQGLGVDINDPLQNLQGGARYLKQMLERYEGDYVRAISAYNAGPGNVDKYGGIPPFKETQNHVNKVLGGIVDPQVFGDFGEKRKFNPIVINMITPTKSRKNTYDPDKKNSLLGDRDAIYDRYRKAPEKEEERKSNPFGLDLKQIQTGASIEDLLKPKIGKSFAEIAEERRTLARNPGMELSGLRNKPVPELSSMSPEDQRRVREINSQITKIERRANIVKSPTPWLKGQDFAFIGNQLSNLLLMPLPYVNEYTHNRSDLKTFYEGLALNHNRYSDWISSEIVKHERMTTHGSKDEMEIVANRLQTLKFMQERNDNRLALVLKRRYLLRQDQSNWTPFEKEAEKFRQQELTIWEAKNDLAKHPWLRILADLTIGVNNINIGALGALESTGLEMIPMGLPLGGIPLFPESARKETERINRGLQSNPEDMHFGNKLGQGLGSAVPFIALGMATGGASTAFGATTMTSAWIGAGTAGVSEGIVNGGTVFAQLKDSGMDLDEARQRAGGVFIADAITGTVLNRFGEFMPLMKAKGGAPVKNALLYKSVLSAGQEGTEEVLQGISSNIALGNPDIFEGAGESFVIGSMLGHLMGGTIGLGEIIVNKKDGTQTDLQAILDSAKTPRDVPFLKPRQDENGQFIMEEIEDDLVTQSVDNILNKQRDFEYLASLYEAHSNSNAPVDQQIAGREEILEQMKFVDPELAEAFLSKGKEVFSRPDSNDFIQEISSLFNEDINGTIEYNSRVIEALKTRADYSNIIEQARAISPTSISGRVAFVNDLLLKEGAITDMDGMLSYSWYDMIQDLWIPDTAQSLPTRKDMQQFERELSDLAGDEVLTHEQEKELISEHALEDTYPWLASMSDLLPLRHQEGTIELKNLDIENLVRSAIATNKNLSAEEAIRAIDDFFFNLTLGDIDVGLLGEMVTEAHAKIVGEFDTSKTTEGFANELFGLEEVLTELEAIRTKDQAYDSEDKESLQRIAERLQQKVVGQSSEEELVPIEEAGQQDPTKSEQSLEDIVRELQDGPPNGPPEPPSTQRRRTNNWKWFNGFRKGKGGKFLNWFRYIYNNELIGLRNIEKDVAKRIGIKHRDLPKTLRVENAVNQLTRSGQYVDDVIDNGWQPGTKFIVPELISETVELDGHNLSEATIKASNKVGFEPDNVVKIVAKNLGVSEDAVAKALEEYIFEEEGLRAIANRVAKNGDYVEFTKYREKLQATQALLELNTARQAKAEEIKRIKKDSLPQLVEDEQTFLNMTERGRLGNRTEVLEKLKKGLEDRISGKFTDGFTEEQFKEQIENAERQIESAKEDLRVTKSLIQEWENIVRNLGSQIVEINNTLERYSRQYQEDVTHDNENFLVYDEQIRRQWGHMVGFAHDTGMISDQDQATYIQRGAWIWSTEGNKKTANPFDVVGNSTYFDIFTGKNLMDGFMWMANYSDLLVRAGWLNKSISAVADIEHIIAQDKSKKDDGTVKLIGEVDGILKNYENGGLNLAEANQQLRQIGAEPIRSHYQFYEFDSAIREVTSLFQQGPLKRDIDDTVNVSFFIKGLKSTVKTDQFVFRGLLQAKPVEQVLWIKTLHGMKKLLTKGTTGSPAFAPVGFAYDMYTAWIFHGISPHSFFMGNTKRKDLHAKLKRQGGAFGTKGVRDFVINYWWTSPNAGKNRSTLIDNPMLQMQTDENGEIKSATVEMKGQQALKNIGAKIDEVYSKPGEYAEYTVRLVVFEDVIKKLQKGLKKKMKGAKIDLPEIDMLSIINSVKRDSETLPTLQELFTTKFKGENDIAEALLKPDTKLGRLLQEINRLHRPGDMALQSDISKGSYPDAGFQIANQLAQKARLGMEAQLTEEQIIASLQDHLTAQVTNAETLINDVYMNLAGQASADLLNYSRTGLLGRGLGTVIPYFNVGQQSYDALVRNAGKDKGEAFKMFGRAFFSLTLPAVASYLKFRDDEDYWQLPPHVRHGYYLLPYKKDGVFYKIPIPPEFAIPFIEVPLMMLEENDETLQDVLGLDDSAPHLNVMRDIGEAGMTDDPNEVMASKAWEAFWEFQPGIKGVPGYTTKQNFALRKDGKMEYDLTWNRYVTDKGLVPASSLAETLAKGLNSKPGKFLFEIDDDVVRSDDISPEFVETQLGTVFGSYTQEHLLFFENLFQGNLKDGVSYAFNRFWTPAIRLREDGRLLDIPELPVDDLPLTDLPTQSQRASGKR